MPTALNIAPPRSWEELSAEVQSFQNYGRLQMPQIETIRIPFEGKEIVCYLQLPKSDKPMPVVPTIGGLDSYKEYTAERAHHARGDRALADGPASRARAGVTMRRLRRKPT